MNEMTSRMIRLGFFGSVGWLILAGLSLVLLVESGALPEAPEPTAWTWASLGLLAIAVLVLYPLIIYAAPPVTRIPWLCLVISMVLVEGARIFFPDLFTARVAVHIAGLGFGLFATWRFRQLSAHL